MKTSNVLWFSARGVRSSAWLALVAACLVSSGCGPEVGKPKGPPTGPFVVSDYFAPSGAMGDGSTAGNVTINETPCPPRPEGARGICYSLSYVAAEPYETPISHTTGVCNWAGLYLQYPTNNWGTEPGLPIPAGVLSAVRFYAAVAEGSELVTFAVGGIGTRPGDPPPSNACPPLEVPPGDYYDQLANSTSAMLGTEWQRVEVPLSPRFPGNGTEAPVPIETLLGALAWSVSATTSPLPKTIFVDDVVYE